MTKYLHIDAHEETYPDIIFSVLDHPGDLAKAVLPPDDAPLEETLKALYSTAEVVLPVTDSLAAKIEIIDELFSVIRDFMGEYCYSDRTETPGKQSCDQCDRKITEILKRLH